MHRLTAALDAIEPAAVLSEEQRGVWTVTGRDAASNRVLDFVDSSGEEVGYVTVEDLLTEEVLDRLRAASERGIPIELGGTSRNVEDDSRDAGPEAELFESSWDRTDTPAGRLLMVDGEKTLVSVLVASDGEHPPEPLDGTAIWGSGGTNSLVVVLKAVFA